PGPPNPSVVKVPVEKRPVVKPMGPPNPPPIAPRKFTTFVPPPNDPPMGPLIDTIIWSARIDLTSRARQPRVRPARICLIDQVGLDRLLVGRDQGHIVRRDLRRGHDALDVGPRRRDQSVVSHTLTLNNRCEVTLKLLDLRGRGQLVRDGLDVVLDGREL